MMFGFERRRFNAGFPATVPDTPPFHMAYCLGAEPRALARFSGIPRNLRYGNYFTYGDTWLLVRNSRLPRPFWGLHVNTVERFRRHRYALVLLTSSHTGWVFTRTEVERLIVDRRWRVAQDSEIKIYPPLPQNNHFKNIDELRFLLKTYASSAGTEPVHQKDDAASALGFSP